MSEKPIYPDISAIFQRKAEARQEKASLSFAEKVAMVEALNERLEPFKRAREKRMAEAAARKVESLPSPEE